MNIDPAYVNRLIDQAIPIVAIVALAIVVIVYFGIFVFHRVGIFQIRRAANKSNKNREESQAPDIFRILRHQQFSVSVQTRSRRNDTTNFIRGLIESELVQLTHQCCPDYSEDDEKDLRSGILHAIPPGCWMVVGSLSGFRKYSQAGVRYPQTGLLQLVLFDHHRKMVARCSAPIFDDRHDEAVKSVLVCMAQSYHDDCEWYSPMDLEENSVRDTSSPRESEKVEEKGKREVKARYTVDNLKTLFANLRSVSFIPSVAKRAAQEIRQAVADSRVTWEELGTTGEELTELVVKALPKHLKMYLTNLRSIYYSSIDANSAAMQIRQGVTDGKVTWEELGFTSKNPDAELTELVGRAK